MAANTIKILGAGPAGLSCAINLAIMDKKVVIFEKRSNVGSQFKHTVHSIKNYSNFFSKDIVEYIRSDLNLDIKSCFFGLNKFYRYKPDMNSYYTEKGGNEPIVYNILRGAENSIDQELFSQAVKLGVEFELNKSIRADEADVVATGARYGDFIGYGISTDNKALIEKFGNDVHVFFNYDFAPYGYAYIIPFHKEFVTLSVFVTKKTTDKSAKSYFEIFQERIQSEFSIDMKNLNILSEDAGIGFYNLYTKYNKGKTLFTGTAAGLTTADYGFALFQSLLSGKLAAESIVKNTDYDDLIKENLYPELYKSIVKRALFDRMNNDTLQKKMDKDQVKIENNNHIVENNYSRSFKNKLLGELLIFNKRLSQPL